VAGRLRHAAEFALAHLASASREAVLALEALKTATSG
jgi:hypothetical protein